jgi:alpha-glucosidase
MFWHYINDGIPMLKPLVYFDQEDPQTHYRTDEFLFGNQIFVCPILEPNAQGRRLYLPQGNWYNYWTQELVRGKRELWVSTDFDQIPIFIKEGAIIPKYPVQQYVGQIECPELRLEVYFKLGKEKSYVFEDAQDGYDYTKGRYSYKTFSLNGKENELFITQHQEGSFETQYQTITIQVIGLPFEVKGIEIDNEKILFDKEAINVAEGIVIDKDFTELHIIGV